MFTCLSLFLVHAYAGKYVQLLCVWKEISPSFRLTSNGEHVTRITEGQNKRTQWPEQKQKHCHRKKTRDIWNYRPENKKQNKKKLFTLLLFLPLSAFLSNFWLTLHPLFKFVPLFFLPFFFLNITWFLKIFLSISFFLFFSFSLITWVSLFFSLKFSICSIFYFFLLFLTHTHKSF